MKKFPIALQLYSVRGDMEADFTGTLKKVKALGYDGVEFAGLFGRSAQEVRAQLDEIGLRGISAHVPYAEMMTDPEKVLSDYAAIGCKYIAIPYAEEVYRPGGEKFEEMTENAKMLGRIAREKGMILLYHNHDFEFQKIDGEYGLDILYKRVPADLLQTELDTCWVNVGGEEPAAYIEKYAGRAPVVHLKDFVMPAKSRRSCMRSSASMMVSRPRNVRRLRCGPMATVRRISRRSSRRPKRPARRGWSWSRTSRQRG